VNLDGPVRIAANAGSGKATITLSFDAWKEGRVAPTTHTVAVLPPKAGPQTEPSASNLIGTLVHPERKANVCQVEFSPDGTRLFTAGYPSGILQVWDVASMRQVRRIDSPAGYRSSADYACLTPDWKTVYVPVEKRSVKSFEKNGKKSRRVEEAGKIQAWDVYSGKQKEPLSVTKESAPVYAKLAAGGRFLICIERPSYDSTDNRVKDATVVWDLTTGKKWKLCDGFAVPSFSPDGNSVVVNITDYEAKTSFVKVLELGSSKQLAEVHCPDKERNFSVGPISLDGSVVSVNLGGKKAAPLEIWFLDARTLEHRGKLVGKGDPERYGWGTGKFTPDSKRFIALDGAGNALVWNVAAGKLERTVPFGGDHAAWMLAISPDGHTAAVGWAPKGDKATENAREPDPQDLPQPRVSLIALDRPTAPRVLVAPHGYVGGVAFSPNGKTLAFGSSGGVHLFDLTR
jgi:WD40 repeat protein